MLCLDHTFNNYSLSTLFGLQCLSVIKHRLSNVLYVEYKPLGASAFLIKSIVVLPSNRVVVVVVHDRLTICHDFWLYGNSTRNSMNQRGAKKILLSLFIREVNNVFSTPRFIQIMFST